MTALAHGPAIMPLRFVNDRCARMTAEEGI